MKICSVFHISVHIGTIFARKLWVVEVHEAPPIHLTTERTLMKITTVFALVATSAVVFCSIARADLTSQYNVIIYDINNFNDNTSLFQLFNDYFADQLKGPEGEYACSNDLYNARGVDPYTDWTTSGSQMVGAFKVADLGHDMSMVNSSGETVASLVHFDGTENIGAGLNGGITDLGAQSVTNIPDGLHVNFQLDAYWQNSLVYSWSSNPELNDGSLGKPDDGMVHMLAFDVTDLYNAKYNTSNASVYMFAWEDLHLDAAGGGERADWDYQDFVAIVTNVKPDDAATPEPATMLVFGLGLAGLGCARRMKING